MNSRMVVAVDVDEVCADLLGEWLRRYNARYSDNLTSADIAGWDFSQQLKPDARGGPFYDILREPDMYNHIQPLPGALAAISSIKDAGHRVVYVSSCVEGTADAKQDWLRRHGFLDSSHDFIAASDKSLIRADCLLDDRPLNVDRFLGEAFLIAHPHNRHYGGERLRVTLTEAASIIRSVVP